MICSRHRIISPRSPLVQCRLQSTHAALRPRPTEDTEPQTTPALRPSYKRPFAIEQVDGRARHLKWSSTGRLVKEWRELAPAGITTSQRASRFSKVTAWLRQMFLPTNYPQSVHRSYMPYHVLQFAETIVGTLVSVLCNQALLVSVGVSAEGSIFGAVAVQWIIKDGAGEVAKLFFIRRFSPFFDSHPKTFNLIGAGSVLVGSGLQIASLFGTASTAHFLMCAAGGNIFKLIGNAIWFTTHIKFVRFFSIQGNMGDVAAKSESQASVGQLLGYAAGIGLLTFSHSASYLYAIFAVSVPLHMIITGWMLRVASFEMLTLPRLSSLASGYVAAAPGTAVTANRGVVTLGELDESKMTGLFGEFYKSTKHKYLHLAPRIEDVLASASSIERERWEACVSAFDRDRYLLYPTPSRRPSISILYHPNADTDDVLRSVLHATALRRMLLSQHFFTPLPTLSSLSSSSSSSLPTSAVEESDAHAERQMEILRSALHRAGLWTATHYDAFREELERCEWRVDEVAFADHGRRVLWGTATSTVVDDGLDEAGARAQ
ncbi:hypothetical protein BDW22DRAFT_1394621 [Trametopsis cervina]|nr:hypothetical protein BDW22DRAFT_1394621 [Trametopsis cervina]